MTESFDDGNPATQLQVTVDKKYPFFIGYDFIPQENIGYLRNDLSKLFNNSKVELFGPTPLLDFNYHNKKITVNTGTRVLLDRVIKTPTNLGDDLVYNTNSYIALYYNEETNALGLYEVYTVSTFPNKSHLIAVFHPSQPIVYGVNSDHITINQKPYIYPQIIDEIDKRLSGDIGTKWYILDDLTGIYNRPDGIESGASDGASPLVNSMHSDLYSIFDTMKASDNDYITKTLRGNDPTGLPIYQYVFSRRDDFRDMDFPDNELYRTPKEKPKVIITSGVHGDEKSSTMALVEFLKDLVNNHENNALLAYIYWNIDFVVVPCCNPWGWDNNARNNLNGVSIGGDFLSLTPQVETDIIKNVIDENLDAIYHIDYHNIGGGVTYGYCDDSESARLYTNTIQTLARKWKKDYQLTNNVSDFGKVRYLGAATPPWYARQKGIDGFTLELGWQPFFAKEKYDKTCIEVRTELIGNILLNVLESKM